MYVPEMPPCPHGVAAEPILTGQLFWIDEKGHARLWSPQPVPAQVVATAGEKLEPGDVVKIVVSKVVKV